MVTSHGGTSSTLIWLWAVRSDDRFVLTIWCSRWLLRDQTDRCLYSSLAQGHTMLVVKLYWCNLHDREPKHLRNKSTLYHRQLISLPAVDARICTGRCWRTYYCVCSECCCRCRNRGTRESANNQESWRDTLIAEGTLRCWLACV